MAAQKELMDKAKNGEDLPSLEVVLVVLVQCNLVDNHDQQKSEVLYTLNVQPSNLVFLKTYNTKFDEIIITYKMVDCQTWKIMLI